MSERKEEPQPEKEIPNLKPNKEMADSINHGISEISKGIQQYIAAKYSHDKTGIFVHLAIVFVIMLGIFLLRCKLDASIIGTLIGSLIGFSFGNFPKNGNGNSGK